MKNENRLSLCIEETQKSLERKGTKKSHKACITATILTDIMEDIYGLMSTGQLVSSMHQGKFPKELTTQLCSEVSGTEHIEGWDRIQRKTK